MALYVRELTSDERTKLQRLAKAQTAPVRWARRAAIILRSAERQTVPTIARDLGLAARTVRIWVERFNAAGVDGLDDAPRTGRPPTYTEDHRSRVIATARGLPPKPASGELPPTCQWTLDRLQAELARDGLAIKRSQIRRILRAEHIAWQKPRTWLESDDPAFAETRGRSSSSPLTHRPAVLSSA
jgi:transposase